MRTDPRRLRFLVQVPLFATWLLAGATSFATAQVTPRNFQELGIDSLVQGRKDIYVGSDSRPSRGAEVRPPASSAAKVLILSPLPAKAQTVADTFDKLREQLKPGDTVWVTDETRRESKGRIVDLRESALVLTTDQGRQEVPARNIMKVRQRHSDSVLNGALIGTAAAVVPMIWWFAPQTESGETASDNAGFIALMVGVGAGAGAGIDAAVRGRKTIFVAPARASTGVRVSPLLSPHAKAARVSILF